MSNPWQSIQSAPRDGTLIELTTEDHESVYRMYWNPKGTNPLVSNRPGIWEGQGGSFTWCEHHGFGPTLWRPIPQ